MHNIFMFRWQLVRNLASKGPPQLVGDGFWKLYILTYHYTKFQKLVTKVTSQPLHGKLLPCYPYIILEVYRTFQIVFVSSLCTFIVNCVLLLQVLPVQIWVVSCVCEFFRLCEPMGFSGGLGQQWIILCLG